MTKSKMEKQKKIASYSLTDNLTCATSSFSLKQIAQSRDVKRLIASDRESEMGVFFFCAPLTQRFLSLAIRNNNNNNGSNDGERERKIKGFDQNYYLNIKTVDEKNWVVVHTYI